MASNTTQTNHPRHRFSGSSFEASEKTRPFSSSSLPSPESVFSKYRDIKISDGPIRVYEYGLQTKNDSQQAPPVVLLHGAMLDTSPLTWRHIMPSLSRDRRVFAIDIPRHGGSRPWPSTITLDLPKLESVLTEILDSLSLPRVSLAGLSLGGGIATGYALSHPSRVSALVAINPGGVEPSRPNQFVTWLATRSEAFLRWSTRHMASSPDKVREAMVKNYVAGDQTRDFDEMMELIVAEARESAKHGEKALDDFQTTMFGPWRMTMDLSTKLEGLEVPSLWVHGNKDQLVREEVLKRAAKLAPNSRFKSILDAGHAATADQPERVYESIAEFLDEVGA